MRTLPILLIFLLLAGSAIAISVPSPITGRVQDGAGQTVSVTNERTNTRATTTVNAHGEFLIEWANTPDSPRKGDVFLFQVEGCEEPACTVRLTYDGGPSMHAILTGNAKDSHTGIIVAISTGIVGVVGWVAVITSRRKRAKTPPPPPAPKPKKKR